MRKPQAAAGAEATDRFEQLFRAHHSAVVAFVRRRAPEGEVDDAVGETFLVAWRRLDRVPAHELPWLLAVARNVLATQHRGAARRRALTLRLSRASVEPASVPAGSPLEGSAEGLDAPLLAALAELSAKDREALTLVAWDGLEPNEAALVLGESAGAFRVRLHRARRRLRKLLEDRTSLAQPAINRRLRLEEPAHD